MPKTDSHNGDVPGNWGPYADLLRHHAAVPFPTDRADAMLPRLDAAIAQRAHRTRTIRFIAAPAVALSTLVAVFTLTGLPLMQNETPTAESRIQPRQSSQATSRVRHRMERAPLPAPAFSDSLATSSVPAEANVQAPGMMAESVHVNQPPSPGPGIVSRANPNENIPIP